MFKAQTGAMVSGSTRSDEQTGTLTCVLHVDRHLVKGQVPSPVCAPVLVSLPLPPPPHSSDGTT